MLYQLNTKELVHTSYLFGTMHLQNEAAFTYKEQILAKINECDAFATEFKLDDADEEKTTEYMNLPPGIFLETLLSKKKFDQIDAFLKSTLRIPLMAFNQSKPLVITNLITTSIFQQDMELALDIYLYQYAKMQGKELLGIETFHEQLEILQKIPLELQVKSLKDLIKNFDQHRLEMNEISDLYAQGKTNELYKLARKSAKGFRRIMLYNRNQIMAERIAKLITEKSICVAVGAGHLEGKRGVIRLLQDAGVTVTKVENENQV